MITDRMKICILAALTLYFALAGASWGRANERIAEFNIPAQALDSALIAFSKQADVQVSVASAAISGMRTQGVVGRFTPSAALARLLAETGLAFSTIGDRTFAVSYADSSRGPAAAHSRTDKSQTWGESSVRLAQIPAQAPIASEGASAPNTVRQQEGSQIALIDEVVVTGSHIGGIEPPGSKLIVIDREAIDRSGFATVQDVVRSLPQNFSGGPSEDTGTHNGGVGLEATDNFSGATALNLRGLGAGSTLVLLDGRRFPSAGFQGSFADVSNLPLAAIERIDVLPDGASAIYGGDAVGGVINFILRRKYDGAETDVRFGSVTDGDSDERRIAQTIGIDWSSGGGLLAFEHYERGALPASQREQAADSDLRPLGGSNFDQRFGNPGTIVSGVNTWAIPSGQDGTDLVPGDFTLGTVNLANTRVGLDLLDEQRKDSLFGTLRQQVSERVEVFADALYTRRVMNREGTGARLNLSVPNTNAFYVNPTGGTGNVRVAYNLFRDIGGLDAETTVKSYQTTLGAAAAWNDWRFDAHIQYGNESTATDADTINNIAIAAALADPNPATAFNPFGDGSFTNPATLEGIRGASSFSTDADIRAVNATMDVPLRFLPWSEARLAVGAEYRRQTFASEILLPQLAPVRNSFARDVAAAYSELFIPFVSSGNERAGLRRLELSLAARYEDYEDFGDTINPKFGLVWSPVIGLSLRGSWGTSFKAPNLADLNADNTNSLITVTADPQNPMGPQPVLILSGKNDGLREETATVWTVGADFEPPALKGLTLGVSYFDIDFEDRIEAVPFTGTWLLQPELADIVTRNPTLEQRTAVCSRGTFLGLPADCLNAPVVALIDLRLNNTAITRSDGFDVIAKYGFDSEVGRFDTGVDATYLRQFAQALRPQSPIVDRVDTQNNPLQLRLRGSLSWSRGGLVATGFVNYSDGYRDTVSVPNRMIDSWTTFDFQLSYRTRAAGDSLLSDTMVSLNLQNAFDDDPPFFNNPRGLGYDPENADLLGRFVSLQLRKTW